MRLRFAPSPTGPLHIGGVRTALYNYLLAKKNQGTFILRIEDTDQGRYVPGAEQYIKDSLAWLGITFDEGPDQGGDFGPYRQSERKAIYEEYVQRLLENGRAYISFDTPQELEMMRTEWTAKGIHSPKYDYSTRPHMRNALTMSADKVNQLLKDGQDHVIRLKVDPGQNVHVTDVVRGKVVFNTSELDDKVLMKSDGMPTYHLANIIDDHLMKITHVIRGEEWLPSTAHHVLLYQAFGWEDTMPSFAHLPLILKPTGKGKLSKRDGAKLGIPVFPMRWDSDVPENSFLGFKEFGFLPAAVTNFLAFLGWNPGTNEEIFDMDQLVATFDASQIGKSGARFDFNKAIWYNHHYIAMMSDSELAALIKPVLMGAGYNVSDDKLIDIANLMKDRLEDLNQIVDKGGFLAGDITSFDLKSLRKKWKDESPSVLNDMREIVADLPNFRAAVIEPSVKAWIQDSGLGFGKVMPIARLALCGVIQGPDLFRVMEVLGKEEVMKRIDYAINKFPEFSTS